MSERRLYETTFIINAGLEDNDIESVIGKVAGYIENNGGKIQEVNKWGRRRLAYPINKKYNGYYVHLIFDANSNSIPILERFMVLEDTVLRHLTLILTTKLREFRVKRAVEQQERLARSLEEGTSNNFRPGYDGRRVAERAVPKVELDVERIAMEAEKSNPKGTVDSES